jgi:hypothetical protein
MSGRWVEVDEAGGFKRPGWLSPGLIVGLSFALLICVVIVGVLISRRGGEQVHDDLTIAQLRGDPEAYDGVQVDLVGTISNRYTIPVLDQYGIYELDDGTGSMYVLSDKGAPPDDGNPVRVTAVFNGAVELDDQIRRLVEDQLGAAAGFIADQLLPGIPLNVVYLTHERFETVADDPAENRYELPVVPASTVSQISCAPWTMTLCDRLHFDVT